jgi:dUTP pyrophosphatase
MPEYGSEGASGMDVFACHDVILESGQPVAVTTGWQIADMEKGFELQVRPRSGNSLNKGYTVTNTPGTIDMDYRGEIKVILHALKSQVQIKKGDKIAQLVPCMVFKAKITESDTIVVTQRGEGGFGSTDAKKGKASS